MTHRSRVIDRLLILAAISFVSPQTSAQLSTQLPGQAGTDSRALIQQMVNSVSTDNMVSTILSLQSFGTRSEYSPKSEAAAEWITNELKWWNINSHSDQFSYIRPYFYDIEAISADTAWLVGTPWTILSTVNGGGTWDLQESSSTLDIPWGAKFINSRTGWVVGTGGQIKHTTDGGKSWIRQNSGTTQTLCDVDFANEMLGVAVGWYGTICRTTDGGLNWSGVTPVGGYLRKVKVVDALNMWTVGWNGRIYCSHDGGRTWIQQTSGVTSYLYSVDFVSKDVGVAVGDNSTLLVTTNGGQQWSRKSLPPGSTPTSSKLFRDVTFADSVRGWVLENTGGLLRTLDRGETWINSVVPAEYVSVVKEVQHTLYVCAGRTVLTSTDGGTTWNDRSSGFPSEIIHTSQNVVVSIPGKISPEKECILVAHYDSQSDNPLLAAPGADDNASGVSALLEAARVLSHYQFESTITLLAVAAEEIGGLGSNAYASQARASNKVIAGVVNADMIGFPLTGDTSRLVVGSNMAHCILADSVAVFNERYGIGSRITVSDSCTGSDHVLFAAAGYSAVTVQEGTSTEIQSGKNPFYHTAHDSLNKLHPGLMRRGAQLLVATAAELAKPVTKISGSGVSTSFSLEQNYPNPFNSGTVLKLKIPQSSHLSLKIFDVLGREVTSLFEGDVDAGPYSFYWKPGNVSSGLYIYQVQAGSFVSSKKMILLK